MKKALYILIVMISVIGCVDYSYPGQIHKIHLDDKQKVPVSIILGEADQDLIVKGTGAKEEGVTDIWKDQDLYIYAFRRDLMTSYKVTRKEDETICMIDGSTEVMGTKAGKLAKVNASDAYLSWAGEFDRVIYYPSGIVPYDFFGYFTDDIKVPEDSIARTENSIGLMLTIDGSQDLMTARAELSEDQLKPFREMEDKSELINIMNYSYSSYTAQRNIQPIIKFRHHLTRLDFELHSIQEGADSIYVDSLVLWSRTKALFTVVDKVSERIGLDFTNDQTYDKLRLKEADGSPLKPSVYHAPPYDPTVDKSQTKGTHLGGSFLVAPDKEYEAMVYVHQIKNGLVYENEYPIKVVYRKEGFFGPGNQYLVKLRVAGLMQIDVDVSVGEWQNGGDVIVDDEDIPLG